MFNLSSLEDPIKECVAVTYEIETEISPRVANVFLATRDLRLR